MNILDNFKLLLFCFPIFGDSCFIDAIDPENQPGSGKIRTESGSRALGLTEDVWHKKYENKKEISKIIWNNHSIKFFKFHILWSEFVQKPDPHHCFTVGK